MTLRGTFGTPSSSVSTSCTAEQDVADEVRRLKKHLDGVNYGQKEVATFGDLGRMSGNNKGTYPVSVCREPAKYVCASFHETLVAIEPQQAVQLL